MFPASSFFFVMNIASRSYKAPAPSPPRQRVPTDDALHNHNGAPAFDYDAAVAGLLAGDATVVGSQPGGDGIAVSLGRTSSRRFLWSVEAERSVRGVAATLPTAEESSVASKGATPAASLPTATDENDAAKRRPRPQTLPRKVSSLKVLYAGALAPAVASTGDASPAMRCARADPQWGTHSPETKARRLLAALANGTP